MKNLIIVGHPNLSVSRVNIALIKELQKQENMVLDILSEKYGKNILSINVKEEQDLLENHNKIVLQFPFQWYSYPPILKSWLDATITDGFAYGSQTKLKDKTLIPAISTGSSKEAYSAGGYQHYSIKEFLTGLIQIANLCSMKITEPFIINSAGKISDEMILDSARNYINYINKDNYSFIGVNK
jgi:glutathione-regulated potassium-efflux system ancillary protein KefG